MNWIAGLLNRAFGFLNLESWFLNPEFGTRNPDSHDPRKFHFGGQLRVVCSEYFRSLRAAAVCAPTAALTHADQARAKMDLLQQSSNAVKLMYSVLSVQSSVQRDRL